MAAGRGDPQRVGFGSGSRLVFGYVFTLKNGRVGLHPPNEIVLATFARSKMGGSGVLATFFTIKTGRVGFSSSE